MNIWALLPMQSAINLEINRDGHLPEEFIVVYKFRKI